MLDISFLHRLRYRRAVESIRAKTAADHFRAPNHQAKAQRVPAWVAALAGAKLAVHLGQYYD
jgi:hypothetical protein